MDSLRRSFKSHGSHRRSISRTTFSDQLEEQPILLQDDDVQEAAADRLHPGDVVVKVEDAAALNNIASAKMWRNGDAWKEEQTGGDSSRGEFGFKKQSKIPAAIVPQITEEPPSRQMSKLIRRQRSGADSELTINMGGLEIEELNSQATSASLSTEIGVSLPPRPPRRRRNSSSSSSDSDDRKGDDRRSMKAPLGNSARKEADGVVPEVIRCSSNAAFQRSPSLLRAKTRSRLMEPPTTPMPVVAPVPNEDVKRSSKIPISGQLRSGLLKSGALVKSQSSEDDDEDPFVDDDIPSELKRAKFSWFTFLECLGFVLILAALVCSLVISRLRHVTVWELHLWKWSLLVLVLICGRLVSGWIIRLAVFLIELNFVLRKRVLYFVYGVRTAVKNFIWLGLVLLSWHFLFDKEVRRETNNKALPYVTKVLLCLLVATLIRLLKTLLIKVLASSFHVSTYFDRIQEAVFNQYVIETLSGLPVVELEIQEPQEEKNRIMAEMQNLQSAGVKIPNDLKVVALRNKSGSSLQRGEQNRKSIKLSGSASKKDGGKQQDEGITIEKLRKLNQKNVSAWNMKRMMKIVHYGRLTTLDEQIRRGYVEDEETTMSIRSECEAKAAAKKIFQNVAAPGSKYIYFVDLMRFMREDDAARTMSLFEGAQERNRVSRKSFKNWMVNSFRDRKALSLTLNDTKTVVNTLHRMANVIVGLIVIVIWLLILGLATTHFFVLLSSQILLAVFIFGNTVRIVFEALVFLFVMHPFDVGDRCEIDGIQMVVEEMNIMTTVFLRYDNQKLQYPNNILATKSIGNFYRSPDMGESIEICVHVATPVEKIAIMRDRILKFMNDKTEHWYLGDSAIVLRDVDDMNRLRISIWMRHRVNFQDMLVRFQRRELVLEETIKVLKELDIEYRMLPFDVNIRNMPSITSSRVPSNWTTFN